MIGISSHSGRFGVLLGAVVLSGMGLLALPQPAQGGIVIMENGNVEVGRIRPDEVIKDEHLVMRWPFVIVSNSAMIPNSVRTRVADRSGSGQTQYNFTPRGLSPRQEDIRWYSIEDDELTDEYWTQHHLSQDVYDRYIDPATGKPRPEDAEEYWVIFRERDLNQEWHGVRDRWVLEQQRSGESGDLDWVTAGTDLEDNRIRLTPRPVEGGDFFLRKPEGWTAEFDSEDRIMVIMPDDRTSWSGGFVPRIHVYSTPTPPDTTNSELSKIVLDQMRHLAGRNTLEIKTGGAMEAVPDGQEHARNQDLLTITTHGDSAIWARRMVYYRQKNIYFFTAYAHADDYDQLSWLYGLVIQHLQIHEDNVAAEDNQGGGEGGG
jgi:hypothetical protein